MIATRCSSLTGMASLYALKPGNTWIVIAGLSSSIGETQPRELGADLPPAVI